MGLDWNYFFIFALAVPITTELPDLSHTETDPITVNSQESISLKCSVRNLEKFSVIWKRIKFGRVETLSANTVLVTNDHRFAVTHTDDDWVLTINEARLSDSAHYLCETNSIPIIQVSIFVTVKSSSQDSSFPLSHNYTACCIQQEVPENCLGFCSLQNIVLGTTGSTPQNCREHLPVIAGCMADGRNHTPCCIRERIPEMCRDICVGKFGIMNETIVHHYACSRFSRAMLACIAEGVEILPGPPLEVQVEPLSESEIRVSWKPPTQNLRTISYYILNVTELSSFDENEFLSIDYDSGSNSTEIDVEDELVKPPMSHSDKHRELTIANSSTSTVVRDLKPFTMYEIYLISVNSYGTSLPTYRLRTLTLNESPTPSPDLGNSTMPSLPDIRACCAGKGMTQERCLNLFCDPVKADLTNLTDVMICAPWINASVACLTGGIDHTPCCRQRGLPELCISLCRGNISRIDFKFFRCIAYMNSYTSCLMEGYGVLTSAPLEPLVKNIHSNWAILQWVPPVKLGSTVTSYNIHYKVLSAIDEPYIVKSTTKSPYLLDHLHSDTEYEVYISAVNQYGTSGGSPRVVFQTLPGEQLSSDPSPASSGAHNLTDCCIKSRMNDTCMPLCNYRAKMADLQRLAPVCMSDFHKLLKCGVGGRNHMPCCMRRMVRVNCASMCAGMVSHFSASIAALCIRYIPDIIHCMEEGNENLPGPIRELHAVAILKTSVQLEWEPPLNSTVVLYEIHYQGEQINKTEKTEKGLEKVVNVTETEAVVDGLESGILYNFYIVAVNDFGSSLPSSILTFHTEQSETHAVGVVSPPHTLMVRVRNVTSLKISWLPPDFSQPHDRIEYNVFFKYSNDSEFTNFTTSELSIWLRNLTSNSEYIIFVTASTDKGDSLSSEILHAWTDTIYPAFVEIPRIHPAIQIAEGSKVTVLCVATGTPTPTVGVYVNGVLIIEDVTRHMVAMIPNVTRSVDTVMCTADNGYGPGSHAIKHIQVSYSPKIDAIATVYGKEGQRVILECTANGYPNPTLSWWRDSDKHSPVISNENFVVRVRESMESADMVMQLIITKPNLKDEGSYYCSAENPFGNALDEVKLKLEKRIDVAPSNVSECCHRQMVKPECLEACTFDVDIDTVIDLPNCMSEITKLVFCAADGSDHRRCCHTWGVPRRCIGLCQGKSIQNAPLCLLTWGKQIIQCFQEGKHVLPGVPRNVVLSPISDTSVFMEWDPPLKNPQVIQYYRVSGRLLGREKNIRFQNDTHGLSMTITGLKKGADYEFMVKAGNHYGASQTSDPIRVALSGNLDARAYESSSNSVAVAVGIVTTLIVLVLAAVAAFVYFRRKYRPQTMGGVSFENPSYMRETAGDNSQTNGQEQGSSNITDNGWKVEVLHSVSAPDNVYEVPSDNKAIMKNSHSSTH